ncbi:HesA/MoeB/ThiF family protein [uncultured Salegentibacter sp.]|uniref:HesA/MoeB/ThiF family protein n=1 Tax=uncultured Salegentibacter sp. TaxID=259320 RepID=UPI00338FE6D0
MLTRKEKQRYNRHTLLAEIGEGGQSRLKDAKVLVIGAGGLGCPVLQYLAAAGVGKIGIIDDDVVDISNLQRQILYVEKNVGEPKVIAAKNRLQKMNSAIDIVVYNERLTANNAQELFLMYDIIVEGSDNFTTKYLANDAAVLTNKPLVFGSIYKFDGQVSVFNYKNGPTYRCLFPSSRFCRRNAFLQPSWRFRNTSGNYRKPAGERSAKNNFRDRRGFIRKTSAF